MGRAWREIPYMGSFQRATIIRSTDPLSGVWREVERVGTTDSVARIAAGRSQPPAVCRPAVLKMRQAVELRRAGIDASLLTKPLLLYYSMLNLVRGVMLPTRGDFGARAHGLSYSSGPTLLECKAEVSPRGTFRAFAESVGVPPADLDKRVFSLRDLFAVIPETLRDFYLLRAGPASVVWVTVESFIGGFTYLTFQLPDVDEATFASSWQTMFPWMAEVCDLDAAFRLRLKVKLQSDSMVAEFCSRYLIHDMRPRDSAVWLDHRVGGGVVLLPRIVAYLAAMFILSNVCRYEPDYLEDAAVGGTDLGFFLGQFLSAAERFFPHLVLELMSGKCIHFE